MHYGVIRFLHPVPASVAIHCIVTPHDCGDFSDADARDLCFQFCQIPGTALRWRITTIEQAVDEDIRKALAFRQLQQCVEVGIVGMYPAIREEAGEVQPAA